MAKKPRYRLRKTRPAANNLYAKIFNIWTVKCRDCRVRDYAYGFNGALRWTKAHEFFFHPMQPQDLIGKTVTFKITK